MFIKKIKLLFLIVFFSNLIIRPQNYDIIPYLIQIEKGNLDSIKSEIDELNKKYPNDPNVLFLDAVATTDAELAIVKFQRIIDSFPKSKYADAAVYRLFNYYLTIEDNDYAEKYFNKLKDEYSDSPYLRLAQSQFSSLSKSNDINKEPTISQKERTKNVEYKYTIQAGAFSKKENAISLKTHFEKSGIYNETKEKNVAGTIFTVVYAGKFETREDAENFLAIINSQFKLQGRVVEIGK